MCGTKIKAATRCDEGGSLGQRGFPGKLQLRGRCDDLFEAHGIGDNQCSRCSRIVQFDSQRCLAWTEANESEFLPSHAFIVEIRRSTALIYFVAEVPAGETANQVGNLVCPIRGCGPGRS